MAEAEKTLDQQVIVYDAAGNTGVVYETAYTETQVQAGILRCRNTHGAKCEARVLPAVRRFAGEKR